MSNGPLTQSINSLRALQAQINAISGLPADVHAIESRVVAAIDDAVPKIQQVQSATLGFAGTASSTLDSALAMVDTDLSGALTALQSLQKEATATQGIVDARIDGVQSEVAALDGDVQTLVKKAVALDAQVSALQAQVASKKAEAAKAKKKELYLIALGPLGLIGLAAAIAVYEKLQSEVNDLDGQAATAAAQQRQVAAARTAVQTLDGDARRLVASLGNVRNALDFVSNDIARDIDNAKAAEKSGVTNIVKLFIQASISEVATLRSDAG